MGGRGVGGAVDGRGVGLLITAQYWNILALLAFKKKKPDKKTGNDKTPKCGSEKDGNGKAAAAAVAVAATAAQLN